MINRKITCSDNICSLNLYFNVHTRRQVKPHQHVDRLGVGIEDVDQAVVRTDFEVLV
jgi:hypothetical protein